MGRPTTEQVRRRIKKQEEGSVFLVRDFLDLGRQETITRILSRLASEGLIRRLQQGVYEYPRMSKLLGKVVPPDPAKVAEAMARRTGSQIVPTRAQTANVLGLTTQIGQECLPYQQREATQGQGGKPDHRASSCRITLLSEEQQRICDSGAPFCRRGDRKSVV